MPEQSSSSEVSAYRWAVLSVFMLIAMLSQVLWLTFAPISSDVATLFNVTLFDVSMLSLVWPIVFVVLAVPAGIFIDRKGFLASIRLAALFLGAFAALRVLTSIGSYNFPILLIAQIGTAVCQPFIFGSITKLASSWFPERERGIATGLGTIGMFLGMMLALVLIPSLYATYGFTSMLAIVAMLCVAGAVLCFIIGREGTMVSPSEESGSFTLSDIWVLSRRRDFVILEYGFFVAVGGFTAILTWLEVILRSLHDISIDDAGIISAIMIIGGIVGSLVIPALSDRMGRIKGLLMLDLAIGTVAFYLLGVFSGLGLLVMAGLVMGFFLMSALPLVLEISNRISGTGMEGRASSLLWFFSQVGSIILIALVDPIASAGEGYMAVILVISVLWASALILFLFLNENNAKRSGPALEREKTSVGANSKYPDS